MTSPNLQALANLAHIGQLKAEAPDARERAGLLRSATVRLRDARQVILSLESRFDLAYNAAHAAALSALRQHGYRSDNRYLVFQSLEHTLASRHSSGCYSIRRTASATWRNTRAISMSRRALSTS
ncbi:MULTISPECIES: hypothetical protein [unclassified Janthinobacterium]|uniref:hypothetical protein n=1 Tax=unclassified Janthinobacterium TaxID=2610881 RepID=UPI001E5C4818|nr:MULTISPECIES: hypothetical protein [unclassified Janthinobacterium]